MTGMTIGQLAREAGVGVETVRFYERRGLVRQPRKPASGYRTYDDQTAGRIRFIQQAQDLGFTLSEIKGLLSLRIDSRTSCASVKGKAEDKIEDIDRKIVTLRQMRDALIEITRTCSGEGPTSHCPILDFMASRGKKGGDKHAIQKR